MSTIADLWALQTTDLAIEAIRTRLAGLEKQKGESPELLAARQALAEAEREVASWRESSARWMARCASCQTAFGRPSAS